MALNIATFKTRALTALIFVAVMAVGLLWNHWSFLLLFTVIHFGCWWEYIKLVKRIGKHYLLLYLFGILYITLPIFLMLDLGLKLLNGIFYNYIGNCFENDSYSPVLPCLIIFSIWINDTMAYIVGSFIGKTPFSKISPKKTWEGTIGGVVLAVLFITLLTGKIYVISKSYLFAVSSISAVAGTAGDLLESKLKRLAGVKDSGSLMPGHGGFLDRFDSLLVATPFVWLYVTLFIK
jgi:phosphatidate cytidylyltransferase